MECPFCKGRLTYLIHMHHDVHYTRVYRAEGGGLCSEWPGCGDLGPNPREEFRCPRCDALLTTHPGNVEILLPINGPTLGPLPIPA